MPTKPTSQPLEWASNAVYATGPFVGSASKAVPGVGVAAEGHRPGSLFPTAAEHENSQQNAITALVRWLYLGTSLPDPDAHVVETNSVGYAGLFGLAVTNNVDGPAALTVSSVNTLLPGATFECLTGGDALQANVGTGGGNALSGTVFAGSGTAVAGACAGTLFGGAAVRAFADAATAADALVVTHLGSGKGAYIEHLGSGVALDVVGNVTSPAVTVQADDIQPAVVGVSGPLAGGHAIIGVLNNDTGAGVLGTVAGVIPTTAASAVRGEATGNAAGVRGVGVTHAGGVFSASNAAGVALYLPGRAADPTNVFNGRMDFNTTTQTWVVSRQDEIQYIDVWATRGGAVLGASTGGYVASLGGSWVTARSLTLSGSTAPHRGGVTITLRIGLTPRHDAGVPNTLSVRLVDVTAAQDVWRREGVGTGVTAGFYYADTVTNWLTPIFVEVAYTVPLAGNRTFELDIKPTIAGTWFVRDASIVALGAF